MTLLSNCLSNLKNGILINKTKIKQKYNKQLIQILILLAKVGIIRYFKIIDKQKNFVEIYIKYNLLRPINQLKLTQISTNTNRKCISYNDLIKLNSKNIFFLSTTKGILTNTQAQKEKIGGLLLFKIF